MQPCYQAPSKSSSLLLASVLYYLPGRLRPFRLALSQPSLFMPTYQPWNVYRDKLSSLYLGIALWEPAPVKDFYDKVSIGDVGYVHNGNFFRMFNVTLQWENSLNHKISTVPPKNYKTMDSDLFAIHTIRFKRGDYYSPGVVRKQNAQNPLARDPLE